MTYDDPEEEIIEELFESLLSRYQIGLKTQGRGSDFIIHCVNSTYYMCHEISSKGSGSYIDSPDLIKKKKVTINQKMMVIIVFNMPQLHLITNKSTKIVNQEQNFSLYK